MSLQQIKSHTGEVDPENHASTSVHDIETSSTQSQDEKQQVQNPDTPPDGGARAWCVAAGSAGVMFCTMGFINSWGVFQAYYQTHQLANKNPSDISWIGSLQIFFLFASGLVGGPLFDRYGAKVIRPAIVVYVFSLMMTSLCKEYYQFILSQGLLGGVSLGLTMAPAVAAPQQYFDKKRGAVMGITIAGSSLGGVILPIALTKMLYSSLGFGWSIRIIGFVFLAILGLAGTAIRPRLPPRTNRWLLYSAFKVPQYCMINAATFFLVFGLFTPMVFLPIYAQSHGMSATLSSYLVAILNACSLPGRVIPGVLSDKLGRLNMLVAAGLSTGILIFCWPHTTTNASIIVWTGLFGFCSGAIISGMSVSIATCADRPQNIGTYIGMSFFIAGVSALISPPVSGALTTQSNGFDKASWLSGTFTLVGGVLALLAKYFTSKGIWGKI